MYNILVVDDVEALSDSLVDLLETYYTEEISSIHVANSYQEALDLMLTKTFDILFLDIELDADKTGFQLLEAANKENFHLVVVTSHAHYALNAIKYSAIDFLLKPVAIEDLGAVFQKVSKKELHQSSIMLQLRTLHDNLSEAKPKKTKLVLKTLEEIKVVKIKDIVRCEADVNYTRFYLLSGEKVMVSKPLKEYDNILSDLGFFRAHKSHLINIEYFESYKKREGGYLEMADKSIVPVSVRKKEKLLILIESL